MMKFVFICLLLVTAIQATKWLNNKPGYTATAEYKSKSYNIGDTITQRHQFPYHAGIFLNVAGFCSGSLISSTVVLTTASCASSVTIYDVHLGAQNIETPDEPDRQVIRSFESKIHEDYNQLTFMNDMAIIILPSEVFGVGIELVRLPSRSMASETFDDYATVLTGWGKYRPIRGPELKYGELTFISHSLCTIYYGNIIYDSNICAVNTDPNSDTCDGDNGSPLVINESDGQPTEIGVFSFESSLGCRSGFPIVSTRVTSYLDWLEINAGVLIRP